MDHRPSHTQNVPLSADTFGLRGSAYRPIAYISHHSYLLQLFMLVRERWEREGGEGEG